MHRKNDISEQNIFYNDSNCYLYSISIVSFEHSEQFVRCKLSVVFVFLVHNVLKDVCRLSKFKQVYEL